MIKIKELVRVFQQFLSNLERFCNIYATKSGDVVFFSINRLAIAAILTIMLLHRASGLSFSCLRNPVRGDLYPKHNK